MTHTTYYLAGLAVGTAPDTTCRENPHLLATEEGQEWYAGWYAGYDETGWGSIAKLESEKVRYLVCRIYAHAARFYENGWDVVQECLEARDIAAHLTADMTVTEAINAVARGEYLAAYNDRRNDVLAAGELPTTKFVVGT